MKIEIDQSGKIEKTSHHTYVAFSNKQQYIIKLSSTEKKKLQTHFRKVGKRRMFVYATFAALIVMLLKQTKGSHDVIIDKEYPGKEYLLRDLIRKYFASYSIENISFRLIGKKSNAHFLAYGAAIGKQKINKTFSARDILNIIK